MVRVRDGALVRAVLLAGLSVAAGGAAAQTSLAERSVEVLPTESVPPELGFAAGSIVAAPIPFSNPTVGNGLALGAAWLFTSDAGSDASSLGLGGFRTDNGSAGIGLGGEYNFRSNRYQANFLAAAVDLTYDFTGAAVDFELQQQAQLYRLDLLYGVSDTLSLGVGARYAETEIAPQLGDGITLPEGLEADLDLEIVKLGLLVDWDRWDNDLFPSSGTRLAFEAFNGQVVGDLDRSFRKAVATAEGYRRGFGADDVLAATLTACSATEEAPFFDSCAIGLTDGFRGFSVTEFIDEQLLSGQVEYRGRVGRTSFGYVLFGGVGVVGEDLGALASAEPHAAAGVGLRYRLSDQFPVDFSVDYTINDDEEGLLYVFVGQAF